MLTGTSETTQPLVWLPADHRFLGEDGSQMPFLVLGDKYARALKDCAKAQPVLFPLADSTQIPALLRLVDGVMLTGSPSNIHPSHFDETVENPSLPLDLERDALTLALVRACQQANVPLLGICRGFQEINVALGGSLMQTVHRCPGHFDHREPEGLGLNAAYARLAHEVQLTPGSIFAQWAGSHSAQVNSLHGQGIARLAPSLRALAHAPDGLIEAVEIKNSTTFAYAVQWHPEWRCQENPFYNAILAAFGQACQRRHASRTQQNQNIV